MSQLGPYIKGRIGSHLSYPIKFTEVRELLAPAIEQHAVEVWLWGFKPPRKNEQRESYPVLEARYAPNQERQWQIFANPVPRELRASIHPLLLPVLAGRVRSWLLATRSPGWFSTYHTLRIRYLHASRQLEIDEHDSA
jgi:hypothetical protein